MLLTPGHRLGPYEILSPLGAGGMGEVYRAKDTRLGRDVAVKVLPTHLSEQPEIRARFEREAKTVSSLNHPNICTLFDVGREGDVCSCGHTRAGVSGRADIMRRDRSPAPRCHRAPLPLECRGRPPRCGVLASDSARRTRAAGLAPVRGAVAALGTATR